ncbi:CopG family transcriptional regulator [Demequina silvatica]|uniref:CopG family transcriptional regulator n=1 Tax=Demequina silvatica TaxID=1638988 RepID=UPI0007852995|nr:CopG family transcriptional regulator [Demequina silvatica]
MKTAISLPDGDFERFERVAARHGMSRSEFYRIAAGRLADELEGESQLTAVADSVLEREGLAALVAPLLQESQRVILEGSDW